MRMRDVGSSTFSWATTIVTARGPLGLYVSWDTPIDGVYDAAAIAVTASANAAALAKTVKRTDLPMAPSFVMSPAVPAQTQIRPESCIAKYEWPLVSLVQSRDGRAGHRCLRLRHGRAHGPPRVLGDDAARGFRLPRRPRPPAVRPSAAGSRSRIRPGDRALPRAAGRQARPRRLQHGHLGRAAAAAGSALGSGRRRDSARGAPGRAGAPQPEDRPARDRGDRRGRTLCGVRGGTRRRCG